MKVNKAYLIITTICIMLTGCSDGVYNYMTVNDKDPIVTKPNAMSFEVENGIKVIWGKDEGAEEYILYRDILPTGSFSTKAYEGTDTSYTDNTVTAENKYYYKLSKKRGKKEFSKSDYSMGVANNSRKDDYEPNDTVDASKELADITDANIYYYLDSYGNEIEDRDWYCVELKSKWYLTISIGGFDTGNLKVSDLYLTVEQGVSTVIDANWKSFDIKNDTNDTRIVHFQISVNKSQFLGAPGAPGGKMGSYQIKKVGTYPVIP